MHTAIDRSLPEVFSAAELARAARVTTAEVQSWIESGAVRALPVGDGATWIARAEAIRAGRASLDGTITAEIVVSKPDRFTASPAAAINRLRAPLAVSGTAHLAALAAIFVITSLGFGHVA